MEKTENSDHENTKNVSRNFITDIIDEDLKNGKYSEVITRFPPEPNGFLHIGHAFSICLNYGIAQDYDGKYNLRYDDTDPVKEEIKYVKAQREDIEWLGFDVTGRVFFASDYFETLFGYAVELIKEGLAYVDDLSAEKIREYRGSLTEPGKESPYRNRTIEENLDLFMRMRKGEFKDGEKVLRAKIDMSSPNMNFRDPTLYRIKHATHYRTGDEWCIYPMYDFTHGQSDAIEGITHSLCSIEFENHRPLYNWFIENIPSIPSKPSQIEFAKRLLNYTVLSKRNLLRLVNENYVSGWDDPRMPTISGFRRRGVPAEAIRVFSGDAGVSKRNTVLDISLFEHRIRENLNEKSPRVMAVLNPLKVIITNYPDNEEEFFEAKNHPANPEMGTRKVPFSREVYIEQEDFMEKPHRKFYRLSPGKEVRLRYAYLITCEKVIKDETGSIKEIHCTYDPQSKGGSPADGRKVKGTLHWVSIKHALPAECRLYDRLYTVEYPKKHEDKDFTDFINPDSLKTSSGFVEPSLKKAKAEDRFQFERMGYFCVDRFDSKPNSLVFNRTITLKDTWAKIKKK